MPISLELMFEHRMYLPMAFLLLFVVTLLLQVPSGRYRLCAGVFSLYLALLVVASHTRNSDWSNALVFYRDAAEKSPSKFRPLYSYGTVLAENGDVEGAWDLFSRASLIDPDHPFLNNQMGNIAWMKGNRDEALKYYERAVDSDRVNPEALYNYASLLERTGKVEDAIRYYRLFIRYAPKQMESYVIQSRRRLSALGANQSTGPDTR